MISPRVVSCVVMSVKAETAPKRKVWIFQGNSKTTYRLYESLCDGIEKAAWLVNLYKNEIRPGDVALIWKAGNYSGIYAVGEIITGPDEMLDLPDSMKYWRSEKEKTKKALRVIIQYKFRRNLTNALFKEDLIKAGLGNLSILKQPEATNFSVSPSEWQIIRDLLKKKYNFEI
jgi:hypothetical protein